MRENNSNRGSKGPRAGASGKGEQRENTGSRTNKSFDKKSPRSFGNKPNSDGRRKEFDNDDRKGGFKPRSKGPYDKKKGRFEDDKPSFKSRGRSYDKGPHKGGFKPKGKGDNNTDSHDEDGMIPSLLRLNQYIARAGVCSRREADKLIAQGMVVVNGEKVLEMGVKVSPTDDVRVDGTRIKPEKKVYILLNKPKDTVTTMKDPHADRIVYDLIKNACEERVYPVGRLDRNTTGVLILTNDGDLSAKLTHPKYKQKKIYHVFLNNEVTKTDLAKIAEGFDLEDGFINADVVSYVDNADKKQIGIEIHSGRNRIVRRMFEHLGYKVLKLDRVYFAGLTKKGVQRGKWRFLTEKEVSVLKMIKK